MLKLDTRRGDQATARAIPSDAHDRRMLNIQTTTRKAGKTSARVALCTLALLITTGAATYGTSRQSPSAHVLAGGINRAAVARVAGASQAKSVPVLTDARVALQVPASGNSAVQQAIFCRPLC